MEGTRVFCAGWSGVWWIVSEKQESYSQITVAKAKLLLWLWPFSKIRFFTYGNFLWLQHVKVNPVKCWKFYEQESSLCWSLLCSFSFQVLGWISSSVFFWAKTTSDLGNIIGFLLRRRSFNQIIWKSFWILRNFRRFWGLVEERKTKGILICLAIWKKVDAQIYAVLLGNLSCWTWNLF